MTPGLTTLYCIKTFYSQSGKMMRIRQCEAALCNTGTWVGPFIPLWVASLSPTLSPKSSTGLIFSADLFLLFRAGLILRIWQLSKLYFLHGLGWRLCIYLNKTATSFQIPPCLQALSTHTQINKGSGSFSFFFFSFDILYQGLFLLILSASCYLKPTSTELCVFAGRLHQTFIVQYCDSR